MSPTQELEKVKRQSDWLGEQIDTLDPSEHQCLREAGEGAREVGMEIVRLGEEGERGNKEIEIGKLPEVFERMTGRFGEAVKEARKHEEQLAS